MDGEQFHHSKLKKSYRAVGNVEFNDNNRAVRNVRRVIGLWECKESNRAVGNIWRAVELWGM